MLEEDTDTIERTVLEGYSPLTSCKFPDASPDTDEGTIEEDADTTERTVLEGEPKLKI